MKKLQLLKNRLLKMLTEISFFFRGITVIGKPGAGRAYFISPGGLAEAWLTKIIAEPKAALSELQQWASTSPEQVKGILVSVQDRLPEGFYNDVFPKSQQS